MRIKVFFYSIITLLLGFILIFNYNLNKIYPTSSEVLEISNFLKPKSHKISSHQDILSLQNYIVKSTKNGANSSYKKEINISALIHEKKGACFDRSLFLQKILLLNNIKFRPVYLYFSPFKCQTTFLDFFRTSTNSHTVIEYYYNSQWFVLETNIKQKKPLHLDEYLFYYFQGKNIKYFRYLSNRNGYMISPYWIPDIY